MRTVALVGQTTLAMAGIFGLGIWVGRMTAPGAADHRQPQVQVTPADAGEERLVAIMDRYREQIGLRPEQMARLEPIFRASQADIEATRPRSQARFQAITQFHERMEGELDENQRARARQMLEELRARVK